MMRAVLQGAVFAVLLALFAWAGKISAERWVLPNSPPRKDILAEGLTLPVPEHLETSHAGREPKQLRQFIFALHNQLQQQSLVDEGHILPIAPDTTVKTMESDADMVRVEILDGDFKGEILWIKAKPFLDAMKAQAKDLKQVMGRNQ